MGRHGAGITARVSHASGAGVPVWRSVGGFAAALIGVACVALEHGFVENPVAPPGVLGWLQLGFA
ncbi:MAG: hypothetical protein ACTS3F_03750 [Phycisphaerales bacterium]